MSLPVGAVAPHAYLFGEDASRVVLSYAAGHEADVAAPCKAAGVPLVPVGTVGGERLAIARLLDDARRSGIRALVKNRPTSSAAAVW